MVLSGAGEVAGDNVVLDSNYGTTRAASGPVVRSIGAERCGRAEQLTKGEEWGGRVKRIGANLDGGARLSSAG